MARKHTKKQIDQVIATLDAARREHMRQLGARGGRANPREHLADIAALGGAAGKGKPKRQPAKMGVVQMDMQSNTIAAYPSAKAAAKATGVSWANIRTAATGKNETAGGFKWKYIPKEEL